MTRLIPLWDLASPSATPMGLPMCQNRLAVPIWSYAMERYPPTRIVELGTYAGGFITALAVHAQQIGARVVTYDRSAPNERVAPLGHFLGVEYRWPRDIWASEREVAASVSLDLAEALVELSGGRPNMIDRRRVDLGDYVRAGGDVECEGTRGPGRVIRCGRSYHEHPIVPSFEWLRRLCDGRFVKL